jgi:hypothetical protein
MLTHPLSSLDETDRELEIAIVVRVLNFFHLSHSLVGQRGSSNASRALSGYGLGYQSEAIGIRIKKQKRLLVIVTRKDLLRSGFEPVTITSWMRQSGS